MTARKPTATDLRAKALKATDGQQAKWSRYIVLPETASAAEYRQALREVDAATADAISAWEAVKRGRDGRNVT